MGFKDLIRKVGSATKKAMDRAAKEIKWRNKIGEAKREVLSRFTIKQLRRIATAKKISLYREDPFTGKRERLRTKAGIVSRLARNLSFNEVVDLAKRYKVKYSDVVHELERFRQELFEETKRVQLEVKTLENVEAFEESEDFLDVDVYNIAREIESEFMPLGAPRDEDDLKKQLGQWLAGRFPDKTVVVEYSFEEGRVDIVIDEDIAIEVKVAWNRQSLKNLLGEVAIDKLYFGRIIAVIFDVGRNVRLETYLNQLEAYGAVTVVIPAEIKRKGRKQEIIIAKGHRKIIIR